MLINTNSIPKVEDIVSLKLSTNDEVIGRLKEILPNEYRVEKPMGMTLVPVQDHPQSPPKGFRAAPVPYVISMEDGATLSFSKDHVITISKTNKGAADLWVQATTSITVPQSNLSGLNPNNIRSAG